MKRTALILLACFILSPVFAQRENFSYKFYGFVRGDLFYNSRANAEAVDGTFYLYPKNVSHDADGKDLNAVPNGSFYTFTTRVGVDVAGPRVGNIKTTAKIEADFGGFSEAFYVLRLRQAYIKFDWEQGCSLLIGQTWHPLFSDVIPEVLNLSTGGPFQPFNRSAQLMYKYKTDRITFTGSAIYQLMSLSTGPNGKKEDYTKNGLIPELFAGINYHKNGFLGGIGVELLSLKPRTESTVDNKTYKVNERITTLSYLAQAQYITDYWQIKAKTLIASNLGHTTLLGGYGISGIDSRTGKQDYTANRHSTSWLNVVYGKKWQYGAFMGYSKNLGTSDALLTTNTYYGSGLDIDQLTSGMLHFSYNIPHWKAGVEYNVSTAWYGTTELSSGKVKNTDAVTNHRILFLFTYYF